MVGTAVSRSQWQGEVKGIRVSVVQEAPGRLVAVVEFGRERYSSWTELPSGLSAEDRKQMAQLFGSVFVEQLSAWGAIEAPPAAAVELRAVARAAV